MKPLEAKQMLQVLPKWKVVVVMPDRHEHVIWISDNFMSNVLRKVADVQFSDDGLNQPLSIHVSCVGHL